MWLPARVEAADIAPLGWCCQVLPLPTFVPVFPAAPEVGDPMLPKPKLVPAEAQARWAGNFQRAVTAARWTVTI